jgi:glycosyltransferase involved in cell wall biosynthesis
VLVTHDSGGGVERVVRDRCEALRLAGKRPILLRPAAEGDVRPGLCRVSDDTGEQYADLCYRLPEEFPELLRLLRGDKPEWVENHHLLGHDPMIRTLAERLGVAAETHLHDYALLCPRVTLVGRDNRYCGEPQDTAVCDACVADAGSNIGEEIATAALRARSAAALAASRRVVVPSAEAATRLRRYFPAVAAEVAPLEDDTRPCALNPVGTRTPRRVAVIGGIGVHKGYDVLLACARDAAQRGLELRFVLVGHSHDDGRLFDTGRVFVTGPYREQDGEALLRAQDADIAWLPSIWPETWGFTLGLAWRAGLQVAAFDIGAMAERIRATGRGWVLPLGLPPASINNALLSMRGVASRPG